VPAIAVAALRVETFKPFTLLRAKGGACKSPAQGHGEGKACNKGNLPNRFEDWGNPK
jgi:hypothetical protein